MLDIVLRSLSNLVLITTLNEMGIVTGNIFLESEKLNNINDHCCTLVPRKHLRWRFVFKNLKRIFSESIPGEEGKKAALGRRRSGLQWSLNEASANPMGSSRAVMAF